MVKKRQHIKNKPTKVGISLPPVQAQYHSVGNAGCPSETLFSWYHVNIRVSKLIDLIRHILIVLIYFVKYVFTPRSFLFIHLILRFFMYAGTKKVVKRWFYKPITSL